VRRLKVSSLGRRERGSLVVYFYRGCNDFQHPCLVAFYAARNPAYLRSLIQFMQHKVPA
jgi:hypothetical protein